MTPDGEFSVDYGKVKIDEMRVLVGRDYDFCEFLHRIHHDSVLRQHILQLARHEIVEEVVVDVAALVVAVGGYGLVQNDSMIQLVSIGIHVHELFDRNWTISISRNTQNLLA